MDLKQWTQAWTARAGERFRVGEPMRLHTSFKIGGPADFWLSPASAEEILSARKEAQALGLPVTVLGNGSNLLVSDLGIEGLVIQIGEDFADITVENDTIVARSGARLSRVCLAAQAAGLSGLEFAYGIPGNVGGAVTMNAGAYGGEVGQRTTSVRVLTAKGEILTVPADAMRFAYRHSRVMEEDWIVLDAAFRLESGDPAAIRETMEEISAKRRDKQPLNFPSAGSVFKRPEGYFAGKLIEDAGLKGASVGDAQVSEKHAGFIVNRGQATCREVETLIRQIQTTVQDRFGVELEPELRRIGRNA